MPRVGFTHGDGESKWAQGQAGVCGNDVRINTAELGLVGSVICNGDNVHVGAKSIWYKDLINRNNFDYKELGFDSDSF